MKNKCLVIIVISMLSMFSDIASAQNANPILGISCTPGVNLPVADYPIDDGQKSVTGSIVVDPLGNVLDKSSDFNFDENDKLEVYVLGDGDLLKNLKVERTSTTRDPGVIRILGDSQGVAQPANIAFLNSLNPNCYRKYEIDDFAPGEGVINISKYDDASNTSVTLGSAKIRVNPLYSGFFSLGVVKTDLVESQFAVENNGTNDVILEKNTSSEEYLYTLMYTPFIWGKRDIEKPTDWWKRINPTLGISLEDISDNLFVGISIDLPANVLITYGKHFGKVDSIAKDSGLSVGDTFTGSIPTSESWEDETFISISFDLRAVNKLFSSRSSD